MTETQRSPSSGMCGIRTDGGTPSGFKDGGEAAKGEAAFVLALVWVLVFGVVGLLNLAAWLVAACGG